MSLLDYLKQSKVYQDIISEGYSVNLHEDDSRILISMQKGGIATPIDNMFDHKVYGIENFEEILKKQKSKIDNYRLN